ncbi:MAG: hypothetical protein RLY86_1771 [Pseudomonadota bacterium]|jgi:uncharacterized membrane protein YedE/YeeE
MTEFTPWAGLLGGILIGLSAVVLMAGLGRIAGISGIAAGAIDPRAPGQDRDWRIAFLVGMVAAPVLLLPFGLVPPVQVTGEVPMLLAAGLLVGIGTRMGSGCTSGHGVCGLARLSPRSLAATLVFMAVALATVFVTRHLF